MAEWILFVKDINFMFTPQDNGIYYTIYNISFSTTISWYNKERDAVYQLNKKGNEYKYFVIF